MPNGAHPDKAEYLGSIHAVLQECASSLRSLGSYIVRLLPDSSLFTAYFYAATQINCSCSRIQCNKI